VGLKPLTLISPAAPRQRLADGLDRVAEEENETTMNTRPDRPNRTSHPTLLTIDEVGLVLRTSKKGVYAMVERGQLPGVVRIGRRVLIREDALLHWLGQKSTPSPER
jgi:excisionase family DNA binding protein